MTWIATYTGKRFDFLDPKPEQIDIVDIAVALSREPRFSGHTLEVFSVAQHLIAVADTCATLATKRYALLHDASEAYLRDITRPVKQQLPEYSRLEAIVELAIYRKFGVAMTPDVVREVKRIDGDWLETERHFLFPQSPPWDGSYGHILDVPGINPLPEKIVRHRFLKLYEELFGEHVDRARLDVRPRHARATSV